MSEKSAHIGSDTLQAYLEGELEAHRRDEIAAHLCACASCADELAGWQLLFQDLEGLGALAPSASFRARVLEGMKPEEPKAAPPLAAARRLPLRKRLLAVLPFRRGPVDAHPGGDTLQDLVDGTLPGHRAAALQTHLAACSECRAESTVWQRLASLLSDLPTFAPAEGFAARVMGEFRSRGMVPAPRPLPSWGDRLAAAARWIVPTSRWGRVAAGSLVVAPAVGLLTIAGIIIAHPLLAPGDLVAFVGWRSSALARAAFEGLIQEFTASGWVL
ncbi:MAG: zf-HC2 domain-containing protein, partial [Gemmatimonadota bacterium]